MARHEDSDAGQSGRRAGRFAQLAVSACVGLLLATLAGVPGSVAAGPAAVPDVIWTRQFGTTQFETVGGVATDRAGNVYVAGETAGELAGQRSRGGQDAFIRSYRPTGRVRWTRQFGTATHDRALDVAVDREGHVVVVGDTFGKLAGPNRGGTDGWVRVYRADGSLLWARQFGTTEDDEARGVAVDAAGNVFVAGETVGAFVGEPRGEKDAFVRKYSPTGRHRWTRQFGTAEGDFVDGAAADSDGNGYVIGSTQGDLGDANAGGWDAFVRSFGPTGRHRWTRLLGTGADEFGSDAEVDASGRTFVIGTTEGGFPDQPDPGEDDMFLVRLSASGGRTWTVQFGTDAGDYAEGIDLDRRGNVYLAGTTQGDLSGQGAIGNGDAFVRSHSAAGGHRWTRQFGTTVGDEGRGVAVIAVDVVIVAGATGGDLAATNRGVSDVFVRRYAPE